MYIQVLNVTLMSKVLNSKQTNREGIDKLNTFSNIRKIIILCLLFILLLLNFIPHKVLLASDFRTSEYLRSWRISQGDTFEVVYTHSVQLTPVSEIYMVQGKDIILTETYFQSFGAGLPSTTPYKFEITDNGFRIYDINEIIDNLVYRTGAVRANHILIIDDEEFKFTDFSKPREGVKFEIRNISAFKYIVKEGLK